MSRAASIEQMYETAASVVRGDSDAKRWVDSHGTDEDKSRAVINTPAVRTALNKAGLLKYEKHFCYEDFARQHSDVFD